MEKLYIHNDSVHRTKDAEIIVPILLKYFQVQSVIDVGCGTGTWLKVCKDNHGISDVLGLDGSYLNKNLLVIDESLFQSIDLRKPFDLKRTFDIAFCLEVAEHLPEKCADLLIESMTKHSDTIVFSAAIPGQGGQNHINERWPDYWERKFMSKGFKKYDFLRSIIWEEQDVKIWYRQNIYIYSNKDLSNLNDYNKEKGVIHPEYWEVKCVQLNNQIQKLGAYQNGNIKLIDAFKIFIKSLFYSK
jgi:SAM-dependent methyltransferase